MLVVGGCLWHPTLTANTGIENFKLGFDIKSHNLDLSHRMSVDLFLSQL